MHFLFRGLIFLAILSFAPLTQVDASSGGNKKDQFTELSKQLPSLPIILLGKKSAIELYIDAQGDLQFARGKIVDAKGMQVTLPAHARFRSFEDKPGLYLVEHASGARPIYRLAQVSEKKIVLGPKYLNKAGPGYLIALPNGRVGMLRRDRNGATLIMNVAVVKSGIIEANEEPVTQAIPDGNHLRLGNVFHPSTGEVGVALYDQQQNRKIRIFFERSKSIEMTLASPIQAFSAGSNSIVLGMLPETCKKIAGIPSGVCTPIMFRASIPSENAVIDIQDLQAFQQLSNSASGWTYATNQRIDDQTNVQVIGDRVYIIQYRGMTQSLGYFSLTNPIKGKLVIPPTEGTNLSFAQINGSINSPNIIVKRQNLAEPTSFLLVQKDDSVRIVFRSPSPPERTALDLSVKTIPSRESFLLPPILMLGKRAVIESKPCANGTALVEVYGGYREPLRPRNPIGLVPNLLSNDGIYVLASIPGSGGFGVPWADLGAFDNARNQTKSTSATVQLLRQSGCSKITVAGFSHGGVVALNALLTDPKMINNVVIGGAPLDIEAEYQAGNKAVAGFLPKGNEHFAENGTVESLNSEVFAQISPRALAEAAEDLSGTKITIFVGTNDTLATTYLDRETIALLRDKGAIVTVIEREGVGHTKFANRAQWAEYHRIITKALNDTD